MADRQQDLEVLTDNLYNLLCGELKVGAGLLKVGGCLKREGKSKEWVIGGIQKWVEENEDALPLLAAALGETGIAKVKAWMSARQ